MTLAEDQTFHSHLGRLPHQDMIEHSVGGWYRTDRGHTLLAVRPTLGDFVREMPRGPQIIYPKDLGNIINMADIFPGATVIESALGSGKNTAELLVFFPALDPYSEAHTKYLEGARPASVQD